MGLQKTFIENLRFYRKQKRISQKDLSVRLDKSFNYINNIEGGISFPPPSVIDQIAEVLGIDSALLFSASGSPQNVADSCRKKFSRSLEEELLARISSAVSEVCRRVTEGGG